MLGDFSNGIGDRVFIADRFAMGLCAELRAKSSLPGSGHLS